MIVLEIAILVALIVVIGELRRIRRALATAERLRFGGESVSWQDVEEFFSLSRPEKKGD